MNLTIHKQPNWQLNSNIFKVFINSYLIPELYIALMNNLNDIYQIYKWDKYLKSQFKWHLGDYPPNAYDVLVQGISNLKCKELQNHYIIQIDYNQVIPGTTAKLYDICEMINSGNLEVSPYPIFSDTFKQMSNIDLIKNLYKDFLNDLDLEEEI